MTTPTQPDTTSASSTPSAFKTDPSRGAATFLIVGLLLVLGGGMYFIFASNTKNAAAASPGSGGSGGGGGGGNLRGGKQFSYAAFDQILNTAQTLINQGENEKAEALFTQVLGSHPEAAPVRRQYAQFLLALKRPKEAYKQYELAIAGLPQDADIELEAGTAAGMAGQFEDAVDHYNASQAANKSDYRAPLNMGLILNKLGRADEAKVALLRAAELKPDAAAPAWGTLADIALRENKADMALQYITKARQLAPDATIYRVIEARAHKRQGNADAALQVLIGLNEAQKREPGVLQTMAECYGMLQRPADAARLYADASDSDKANGDWAFQAAIWLDKAGDKERAIQYAKRAAELKVEGAAAMAVRLGK